MSALFQENIDGSYSLHFTEAELEVLTVLLSNTRLGDTSHPEAAFNLLDAIETGIGSEGVENINAAIPIQIHYDDDNDWCIQVGD